ncbi:MAG: anaerobic ribonucleoside-triphosphate reductase activating protein [candidate division WOR-3 bacterium]
MKISGFLAFSLLDFPGVPASVVFTQGCNFRCPFCHNPELVFPNADTTLKDEELFTTLLKRKGIVKGVVITGGEPTLYKDLIDFIYKIKSNYNLSVKLDTNGSNPAILEKLIIRGLLDFISIDFKSSSSKYHIATGLPQKVAKKYFQNLLTSIELAKKSRIPFEVRVTVTPGLIGLEDLIEIRNVIGDQVTLVLQRFRNLKTLDPRWQNISPYQDEVLLTFAQKVRANLRL